MFERETGRFVFYDEWVGNEICAGEGFSSDEEITEHAKKLVKPYLSKDINGYVATIYRRDYSSFNMYDVLLEYNIGSIVVSRIRVIFPDSGHLTHLELTEYRENAAELTLVAGKDATAREKIAERVSPLIEEGQYTEYEIQPGFLYYDEENRPYVLYSVHLSAKYTLDIVDFLVYVE